MNRIENRNGKYILTLENAKEYTCTRWYEKKVDTWHILVPKEAREACGRTYIREKLLANGSYEFETKTEHRTGLATGGWRAKLTAAEKAELEKAEATIERLKDIASKREVEKVDPNSIEGIQAQIEKLMAKLEAKKTQA